MMPVLSLLADGRSTDKQSPGEALPSPVEALL